MEMFLGIDIYVAHNKIILSNFIIGNVKLTSKAAKSIISALEGETYSNI